MDHVVHTQLKLYSTSWLQSFEALFHILSTGKVSFSVLESSRVGGLKGNVIVLFLKIDYTDS